MREQHWYQWAWWSVFVAGIFCSQSTLTAAEAAEVFRPASVQDREIRLDTAAWKICQDLSVKKGSGQANGWEKPEFDDSAWKTMVVGKSWEEQGLSFDGVVWYRCRVFIPQEWAKDTLFLQLGRPDDSGEAYFNGKKIAKVEKFGPHLRCRLAPELIKFGAENVIAVRVWDWYKNGGLNYGDFSLCRVTPLARVATNPTQIMIGATSGLTDQVLENNRWEYGWRDEGTSDTRPRLSVERGAHNGQDALVMDVWYPNSAEYIDYTLKNGERGEAWSKQHCDYLSFWYQADMAGEIKVRLNKGKLRWRSGAESYEARVFLETGGWKKVIVPFSAFTSKGKEMSDPSFGDTLSLGYGNHELQGPGKIRFSGFEAGAFQISEEVQPVRLSGLWRFKPDNHRPDGTESVFKGEDEQTQKDRAGYGLQLGWQKPEFDDSGWDVLTVPGIWEEQGYNGYDGPAWYRQQVLIPQEWQGTPLVLRLGQPDDRGTLYFNGKEVQNIEKFGPEFSAILPPENIQYGKLNTIAVCISDWHMVGGLRADAFAISPEMGKIFLQEAGKPGTRVAVAQFEMGARPEKELQVVFQFYGKLASGEGQALDYRLVNCFHRTVCTGSAPVTRNAAGELEAVVKLTPAEAKELYYGEWFEATGLLKAADGKPVQAFAWHDMRLKYESRDRAALAALPVTEENTPYGKLKLVDVIDCAKDPATDEHPYKEGGIRGAWVGRRMYATWQHGVTVNEFKGRSFREANNNEFFGYRVGRGKLKPHTAYLLRILVPDDKARYAVVNIDAGRNFQGTGYRAGVSADDPEVHYPHTGEYQWHDHLVMNDEMTYGYEGSRKTSSENGFWIFFHDNGRGYTAQYAAGPAAAEIRLYEVEDIAAHAPQIRYPQDQPGRVLLMDWEREPEAPPADVANWARFAGLTALGPVIQKWAFGGYWRTDLGFKAPSWHKVSPDGEEDEDIYVKWLAGTRNSGIRLIPRIEYGGGPKLPKEAWVVGKDGKTDPCGRYCGWGANILNPLVWEEFKTVVDEIIGKNIKDNPQISGLLWRQRQDRIKCSYGEADVALYCKETGEAIPKGTPAQIAQWASSGENGKKYGMWWQGKRADFLRKARDLLKSYRADLVLYYYNWDEDGWNMGLGANATNTAEDWSNLYNVDKAGDYWRKRQELRKKITDQEYVKMLTSFGEQHDRIYPELFKEDKDIVIFAPVHWRYLADNAPYINYFKTGDGLAVCNMFNYEEKGRTNVQGDNYESSEMTPGGHDFGMAEEVLACFHGDPNVITWTTYTYGRGWLDVHRQFAQAFLALPDQRGIIQTEAVADPNVRVRTYPAGKLTYVGVVSKNMQAKTFRVTVPATGQTVTDLVTGETIPATVENGKVSFEVQSAAMQLRSYRIQ